MKSTLVRISTAMVLAGLVTFGIQTSVMASNPTKSLNFNQSAVLSVVQNAIDNNVVASRLKGNDCVFVDFSKTNRNKFDFRDGNYFRANLTLVISIDNRLFEQKENNFKLKDRKYFRSNVEVAPVNPNFVNSNFIDPTNFGNVDWVNGALLNPDSNRSFRSLG